MLHLNWDSRNLNGIIINEQYPNGALFTGAENKPALSVEYDEFEWDEVDQGHNYISLVTNVNGNTFAERQPIPPLIEEEIRSLATNWVQPLGCEGNPSPEQLRMMADMQVAQALDYTDRFMVADYPIANRDEYIAFRQALRDISKHPDYPNVEWPQMPEVIKP